MKNSIYYLIALTAVLVFTVCQFEPTAAQEEAPVQTGPKNIVMVHGAWVGEWTWNPVKERLEAQGHNVFAVSLKGHGKRSEENGPDITLDDHVNDVVKTIEDNNLTDVTLVMHSYGGLPGTKAWDVLRDRIKHVIYVDAMAPAGPDDNPMKLYEDMRAKMPKMPRVQRTGLMPYMGKPHKTQVIMPQSIKTMPDKVALVNGPLPKETKKTYILAQKYMRGNQTTARFQGMYDALLNNPDWQVFSFPTGHLIMFDAPDVLTAIIDSGCCKKHVKRQ